MNWKKWALLAGTAVVTAALLAGCGNTVSTKTETVMKSEHPVALTLDANITALHMTNIIPKLSGKLVSAPLTVGQEVKAGDVVVQVDAAPYQQSVAAAEAQLAAATATAAAYVPSQSEEASGGDGSQRAKLDVWYQMGAISKVEYNQMMARSGASAPSAAAQPAVDSGQIAQLQQSVQAARDMLGNATIYSPIDGRVTAVNDNPSIAVAGNVLATIQQITPLVATFAVPEDYIRALTDAKGKGSITVTVLAASGETEIGELTYLATEKDNATGAYMAKVTLFPESFITSAFRRRKSWNRSPCRKRLSVQKTAAILCILSKMTVSSMPRPFLQAMRKTAGLLSSTVCVKATASLPIRLIHWK